jgi:hypothetical protein
MLAKDAALLHRFAVLNVDMEQFFTDARRSEFEELPISAEKNTSHLSFSFALNNFINRADIFADKRYFCVIYFEQIGVTCRCSAHKVKFFLLVGAP